MRVLLISHTCQSRTEGQPKADCLGRLPGVELHVLVPDRWKRYGQWRRAEPAVSDAFSYEIGRVRLPWVGPAQTYLHHYRGLGRLLKRLRPDVIDVWEEPWSLVSAQVAWLRSRYAASSRLVVETEQNIDKTLPPPFEWFRRYTLQKADYLVGRSSEAVTVARRKGFAGPASVVPNAFDDALFRPMDREACRRELGVDGFTVGYAGRLTEAKGVSDLIEAVAKMRHRAAVLLIGDGDDAPAFKAVAKRLGVADRVRFLGARPLTELPTFMNAMDALVLPSRTTTSWKEQYGRVIIEAHGCGTAVVGSDSGAIPEVIGRGGVVVPERSPGALAEALDGLAASPDEVERLGEAGREQAMRGCTWQRVAERMHAIYNDVLKCEPTSGVSQTAATPEKAKPTATATS